MKKIFSLLFIIIMLTACSKESATVTRQTFALDTVVNITVHEEDSDKVNEAFSILREYEKIFSRTDPESRLYLLNNGTATTDADLSEVLDFSLKMSDLTDGAFDITIAPLVDLWNVKERTVPPEESKIKNTLGLVGATAPEKKYDMGAVAKGYIADRIAEDFKKSDVSKAIIDLGGNIVLIGEYNVGIRNPFSPNEVFATLTIKDKSAVTSGGYQRYFEYEGKRYHHIIDPRTGYPSDSGIASVTVISPSSMTADALSTSIFILGKDSISLCDNFPDTDALVIMENGDIVTTENFEETYKLKK